MLEIKKPWLLIATYDRENVITGYDTFKEAQQAMRDDFEVTCGQTLEGFFELDEEIRVIGCYKCDEGGFWDDGAWYNGHDTKCDWTIVHVDLEKPEQKQFMYACVTTYTFDPSVPVVLFQTYEAACNYLFNTYSEELALAVEEHPAGYVTESFIEEDMSYAKIVDAYGEDTTVWMVVSTFDGAKENADSV